jgi:putative phosphoribosyl transferase
VMAMHGEADDIVCLIESEIYFGIGGFYDDFHQLTDTEVTALLDARPSPGHRS